MKKTLFIIALTLFSFAASAQSTLTLGYSPAGSSKYRFIANDESYKYSYNINYGITLSYLPEFDFDAIQLAWDLNIINGSVIEDADYTATSSLFEEPGKNLSQVYFMTNLILAINRGHRIQFPVGFGWGFGVASCGIGAMPIILGGLKAQVRFYITPKFGIYAGANLMGGLGLGSEDASTGTTSSSRFADAGICISL
jgi:hypothetical protein